MQTAQADPIITEVRVNRDEYAARFNYDVGAIFRDIRVRQEASSREYVRYPARRVSSGLEETATPSCTARTHTRETQRASLDLTLTRSTPLARISLQI